MLLLTLSQFDFNGLNDESFLSLFSDDELNGADGTNRKSSLICSVQLFTLHKNVNIEADDARSSAARTFSKCDRLRAESEDDRYICVCFPSSLHCFLW